MGHLCFTEFTTLASSLQRGTCYDMVFRRFTHWGTRAVVDPVSRMGMPMFWWLSFIFTLYIVCFCMVVILRKQWVERERLAYPLMEIPEALLEKGQSLNRFPSIFYNRIFWMGMCIPIGIVAWNIVGFFFHFLPEIAGTPHSNSRRFSND